MRPSNRICPVCRATYTGTTATCSNACRAKASRRKRAGQPIANPYSEQEVEEILTELHQLQVENQRLRTGQKRTKDWKAEATKTQAKLVTAQNRLAPLQRAKPDPERREPPAHPQAQKRWPTHLPTPNITRSTKHPHL